MQSRSKSSALCADFPALHVFMLPFMTSNTSTVSLRLKFSVIKPPNNITNGRSQEEDCFDKHLLCVTRRLGIPAG